MWRNDNRPIWNGNARVLAAVNEALGARATISSGVQGQQVNSEGVTEDKEELSDEAIRIAVKIARLVQAYALDEDDDALFRQMQVSETSLDRMADTELPEALEDLHGRATGLVTELVDYGVDTAMLAELQTKILAYRAAMQAPRAVVVERMTHTASIPVGLKRLRLAFKKLDRLMLMFEDSNPDFVSAYRNARVIIDLRGRGEGDVPPAS